MVLCHCKRIHLVARHNTHEREFRAVEEVFNHHTSLAETFVEKHIAKSGLGLFIGHGHDHAFAGCKSVIFDNGGQRTALDILQGFVEIVECFICSGRHIIFGHNLLCKFLAALYACRLFCGAECLQSLGFECIDQPGCKSRLRANHGHVYAVASNEVDDCIDIFHTDCHAFCIFCDSGIARGAVYFVYSRRAFQRFHYGVAASAAANHENFLIHRH